MILVKRWRAEEVMGWHRVFDVLYGRVSTLTLRQVENADCPKLFKEIRKAQIEFIFRKINRNEVSIGPNILKLEDITGKKIYQIIVSKKADQTMLSLNSYWVEKLGLPRNPESIKRIQDSWSFAFPSYEDGVTRSIHYSFVHRAVMTRHRSSVFLGTPNYCSSCFHHGIEVVEDFDHLFLYCISTYNLYYDVKPLMTAITGNATFSMFDLVFGKHIPSNRKKQTNFNIVVHTLQRAILSNKWSHDKGLHDSTAIQHFRKYMFRNMKNIQVCLPHFQFFHRFGGPDGIVSIRPDRSFRLNLP
jgi:hypothetical protein